METGEIERQRRNRRAVSLALLLAVAIPTLFLGLGFSLLDPDEGIYAGVARQMLERGDFVVPHVDGIPYLEKPPLYFWLTALAMALFGTAEWVIRLPSALSALATVLLVWRIGQRLYGATAGLIAGLALATSVGYALFVRRASTDILFTACLTLAIYGFVRDVERPHRGRARFLGLYAGAALAVLAKGLIGVFFPVVIVGAALLWVRRLPLADLNLGRGLALFTAIVLPWHALIAWRAWPLFEFYIVRIHVMRLLNRHFVEDDIPMSTLGFLLVTFLWAFPWGVFLLGRAAAGRDASSRWRVIVIAWVLAVIGLFAMSRFKHEYYALPAFPAIALIAGAAWASARDVGRWLVVALVGCVLVGAWALWIGAGLTPDQAMAGLAELNVYYRILMSQGWPFPFESPRPFGWLLQALGVTLIVGWTLATVCWLSRAPRAALASIVGVAVVIASLIVSLIHVVEPHHSVRAVARAIAARAGPDDLIVHEGGLEYSAALPFYLGRPVFVVNGAVNYYAFMATLPEATGRFLDTARLTAEWQNSRRVFLVTRQPRSSSVIASLPVGAVHELGVHGSRWLYSNR